MRGISVIIPCYNTEPDQLAHAVYSVYGQHIPNNMLEVLLIDDGSTRPDTLNAIRILSQQPSLRVLRQENKGPGAARNAGLDAAKFEFCTFLDSDDFYNNDPKLIDVKGSYLQRAMKALEENENLSFVQANHYNLINTHRVKIWHRNFNEKASFYAADVYVFFTARTEDMRAARFPEHMNCVEDWGAILALQNHRLKEGKGRETLRLNDPHYYYRLQMNGQNVNARKRDYQEIFGFFADAYGDLLREHYGDRPRQEMIDEFTEKTKQLYSYKARFRSIVEDPVWASQRVIPFVLNRVFWAAHKLGVPGVEDPFERMKVARNLKAAHEERPLEVLAVLPAAFADVSERQDPSP